MLFSDSTGVHRAPRYETLILQSMLLFRNVSCHRAECIGGRSLSKFIADFELTHDRPTMQNSKRSMLDLGILTAR